MIKKLLITGFVLLSPTVAMAQQSSAVCQVLASHKPDADVTHVGEADLNPAQFQVPNVIKVPLDINLAQRVASLTGKGVQMEAPMGMVEIHQDGTIRYNDQDWTVPVNTLCGNSYGIKEVIEVQEAPIINNAAPIINQAKILNNTQIINRAPAGDRAGEISIAPEKPEDRLMPDDVIISSEPMERKTPERTMIEIRPTEAIPPQDVVVEIKEEIKTKQPEVIEGGDYREIFYND